MARPHLRSGNFDAPLHLRTSMCVCVESRPLASLETTLLPMPLLPIFNRVVRGADVSEIVLAALDFLRDGQHLVLLWWTLTGD